jgi:hypothetical protein
MSRNLPARCRKIFLPGLLGHRTPEMSACEFVFNSGTEHLVTICSANAPAALGFPCPADSQEHEVVAVDDL